MKNSYVYRICSLAVPRSLRKQHGTALADLSSDLVEGGSSTPTREAMGLLSYGVKKRLIGNKDWVSALPWRGALWLLALPLAAFQLAWFLLAVPVDVYGEFSFARLGSWWVAALTMSVVLVVAAALRNRVAMQIASVASLALVLFDGVRSGGVQAGHGADFGLASSGSGTSIYLTAIPACLTLSLMLCSAACVRPPEQAGSAMSKASRLGLAFVPAMLAVVGDLALRSSYLGTASGGTDVNLVEFGVNFRGSIALAAFVGALVFLIVRGRQEPAHTLAAALLLISQAPLISWVAPATPPFHNFVPSSAWIALAVLFALGAIVLAAATAFARHRFGSPYA